jgi:hypothetical protein
MFGRVHAFPGALLCVKRDEEVELHVPLLVGSRKIRRRGERAHSRIRQGPIPHCVPSRDLRIDSIQRNGQWLRYPAVCDAQHKCRCNQQGNGCGENKRSMAHASQERSNTACSERANKYRLAAPATKTNQPENK